MSKMLSDSLNFALVLLMMYLPTRAPLSDLILLIVFSLFPVKPSGSTMKPELSEKLRGVAPYSLSFLARLN